MTDSTLVFRPGERITGSDGVPSPGAVIAFYEADTTTPRTVYSDSGLTTSLGTSVTTDSAGYPASSGTRTLIYTGTTPYKIICTDSAAALLWTHPNIVGALDTSSFLTTPSTSIDYNVSTVSSTGTWTVANITNAVFEINPGGSAIVRTLPDVALSEGLAFDVTHIGTSGSVAIKTASSDTIYTDGTDTARKVVLLLNKGDSCRMMSDGVSWFALFKRDVMAVRHFAVESQVTSPPGSPSTGQAYVIIGTPSGGFTSTTPACADGDVVVYDGQSNWQIFRPTDGWTVYDKGTSTLFQRRSSAWNNLASSDSAAGFIQRATQAEMETGTAVDRAVTPGRLQYHPGAAKAWVSFTGTGTVTILASHNVSSVTDNGTGDYTVNFTTSFTDAYYCPVGSARYGTAGTTAGIVGIHNGTAPSASACRVFCFLVATTPSNVDMATVNLAFFGDQA